MYDEPLIIGLYSVAMETADNIEMLTVVLHVIVVVFTSLT